MRVQSFIEEKSELVKVEVEVALMPGLPAIHFLGRADGHLKESSLRIKSAIKAAGFDFPVAQQIVVNLRPTHLKKSSRGIELAVAAAYLWMTEQVPVPGALDDLFVYGELSLFGEVSAPDDVRRFQGNDEFTIVTGAARDLPFRRWSLTDLRGLKIPEILSADSSDLSLNRPEEFRRLYFSEIESQLLALLAVGGHHVLLAGPPGCGKSTLARALHGLMSPPRREEVFEIQKHHPEMWWRPMIEPHHTTPKIAMVGGGSLPSSGEITRAHRGILLLDEFLEFDNSVLEALREPIEQGRLRVGRLGGVEIFPADVQVVATTNLCPCGKYVPGGRGLTRCRFSLRKCRSYAERFSGPLLDRFHIVYFPTAQRDRKISGDEILERIEKAFAFQRVRGAQKANKFLTDLELREEMEPVLKEVGVTDRPCSQRRLLATLRVARTLADLEATEKISLSQVDQAMKWTMEPFDRLERWD